MNAKRKSILNDGIAKLGATKLPTAGLADILEKKSEFAYIPLQQINTEKQVRSTINTEDEAFISLVESIKEKGVLEPILVRESGDGYTLISGERRLRACQILDMINIPARIFDKVRTKEEIIEMQLIENLHRENLNPVDEVLGYLEFCKQRLEDQDISVDAIIRVLMSLKHGNEKVKKGDEPFIDVLKSLSRLSGKSFSSLENLFGLLKLPQHILDALKSNKIGLTHAYILSKNLDHPDFEEIFKGVLDGKYSKDALTIAFKKRIIKQKSITKVGNIVKSLSNIRTTIETTKDIKQSDKDLILAEIKRILVLLESS